MIYTLTFNPSLDHHITVKKLIKDDKVTAEAVCVDAGGKGINVSRVIRELGGRTKAFAVIGGDRGETFKRLLRYQAIGHAFCKVKENTRTNLKITDRTDRSHVQINEPGPRLSAAEVRCIIAMIENAKPRPSYWVLAGSLPPGVPDDIYRQLIARFQKRGERCVLDADGRALKRGVQAKPFMIKPNLHELERLVGKKLKSQKQIVAEGLKLSKTIEIVLISLGPKGAILATHGQAVHLQGPPVKVQSHVGAGDAMVGGFLTAFDRGCDVPTAGRWAVAAATASVVQEGTARCERREVGRMVGQIRVRVLS